MEEYLQRLEKNLDALEMEVETLSGMITELSKRVSKEKERGLQTLPEVEKWISMAEDLEMEASGLLSESISECYNLSTYDDCSQISEKNHQYNEMVCLTLKEVEAQSLRSKGVFELLVARAPLSNVQKMLPLRPIVSREMLLEKAWKRLSENECGTLGLYGVAGVGKTFLLTQIKNKITEDREVYGLHIFVDVKSDGVEGIQNKIREKLGIDRSKYKDLSENMQKADTYESLSKTRFVLLLDGVQREGMDFEKIGIPRPSRENGCKIVFTTRSPEEACRSKWVDAEVEVKCLRPEEAWEVFQEIVGESTLKGHPDIPNLARIVARRCGGLPISLSLIGKTMSRKRTLREWYHAIHVLSSSSRVPNPMLKFAYDNLPGENIKSCFLYCALFPKNYDISKQDLVDYWIAEGMIIDEDREIAELKGYEMIGDLVKVGLLMENESGDGVKMMMHDMVLDMAFGIAARASFSGRHAENIVVKCGAKILRMPWASGRTRMSVTSTQIATISAGYGCSQLTTLFLQGNDKLGRISDGFFRRMTSLAVLDLSRNVNLYALPNTVSRLVSLQLLNLSGTSIKRLPSGLKKLRKLIHLDLEHTHKLGGIEVLASLLNLQVLKLFGSNVPVDLGLMEDIYLLKSLEELSLTVNDYTVLQRLQSFHRLAIRRLYLKNITTTEGELLLMKSSLRHLNIYRCTIFSEITIDWRSWETVHSGNIQKLPQFRNIRTVYLSNCEGLEDLTWLLLSPSLGELRLTDCPQMKEVISKEKATALLGQTSQQPFQNLKVLYLSTLPELESIYWTPLPFPALQLLHISNCPKLRRLPLNFESAKGNRVNVNFDQQSIQGFEWEDEATKQRFSHLNDTRFRDNAAEVLKRW